MDFALALVSIGGEFALSYGVHFERGAGELSQRDVWRAFVQLEQWRNSTASRHDP
jgi:hypothetical protein